jgi:hypothetical protein
VVQVTRFALQKRFERFKERNSVDRFGEGQLLGVKSGPLMATRKKIESSVQTVENWILPTSM